ncbi:MAG: hypothetical protein ACLF0G_06175 [Candidatus Brocadiia bacterium]
MAPPGQNTIGQVYRCLVCGAEVSVVNSAQGALAPRCCNEPMTLLPQVHRTCYCEVCGAEIMVLNEGAGHLAPRCCNRPMTWRRLAA